MLNNGGYVEDLIVPVTHIVSYSGGVGSAITAKMLIDKYGPQDVKLLFADTKIEDPDLYRFNADIEKLLGLKIDVIAEGRTPWEVFKDEKFLGNSRIDPCSKILKRNFIKRYLKNNYKPELTNIWIGIDLTESHRLPPVVTRNRPFIYRSILIEENIMLTTQDKIKWCKHHGIAPPRLYLMGFGHNNCNGFCVKAGLGHFKKLYEQLPEVYLENERQEKLVYQACSKARPFLTKEIAGKKVYLTLEQYRTQYLEKNKVSENESLDFGGCGCAL